ncbi:SPOCS domain-containing protein [Clostridium sp. ZS2-4]|uniref:SPOCS domain-containing protein n=1 Tax=Clostridium sp. ZS2-4 TaxID=2987703 RepID=UPI00227A1C2E|nr:SPOCS domain-containing protein [Clostridium sp. ZS2-4]MCY6355002.1 DUF3794 domain-containing protein [Clostridium sp. ZS2-4]
MQKNIYYPNIEQDFIEPNPKVNIVNKELEEPNKNENLDSVDELNGVRLVGKGTGQELIERKIIFNPPKKDVVVELISINKEVKLTEVEVNTNSVVVNGYIHNSIMYKTIKRPDKENEDTNKNENKDESKKDESKKDQSKKDQARPSCEIITVGSIAVDGVVRHTTVWVPFKSFIAVNGARKGDIYEILYTSINEKNCFLGEVPIYEEDKKGGLQAIQIIEDIEEQPFIEGIIDKNLIKISVEVKRA